MREQCVPGPFSSSLSKQGLEMRLQTGALSQQPRVQQKGCGQHLLHTYSSTQHPLTRNPAYTTAPCISQKEAIAVCFTHRKSVKTAEVISKCSQNIWTKCFQQNPHNTYVCRKRHRRWHLTFNVQTRYVAASVVTDTHTHKMTTVL